MLLSQLDDLDVVEPVLVGPLAEPCLGKVGGGVLYKASRGFLLYSRVEEQRSFLVVVQAGEGADNPARAVLEAVEWQRGLLVEHLVRRELDQARQVCDLRRQEPLMELLLVLEDAGQLEDVN